MCLGMPVLTPLLLWTSLLDHVPVFFNGRKGGTNLIVCEARKRSMIGPESKKARAGQNVSKKDIAVFAVRFF